MHSLSFSIFVPDPKYPMRVKRGVDDILNDERNDVMVTRKKMTNNGEETPFAPRGLVFSSNAVVLSRTPTSEQLDDIAAAAKMFQRVSMVHVAFSYNYNNEGNVTHHAIKAH